MTVTVFLSVSSRGAFNCHLPSTSGAETRRDWRYNKETTVSQLPAIKLLCLFLPLTSTLRFPPISFSNYSLLALSFSCLLFSFFFLFHFSSTLHLSSCRIFLPLRVCVLAANWTSESCMFVICRPWSFTWNMWICNRYFFLSSSSKLHCIAAKSMHLSLILHPPHCKTTFMWDICF